MGNCPKKRRAKDMKKPLDFCHFVHFNCNKDPLSTQGKKETVVPSNWLLLNKCPCFRKVFSTDRIEKFKEKVEKELINMMKESSRHVREKAMQTPGHNTEDMYILIENAIKKASNYALQKQQPPTMSPILCAISFSILELLASLYNTNTPSRQETNKDSQFLIYIADWAAKIMSHGYCKTSPTDDDADDRIRNPSSKLSVAEEGIMDEKASSSSISSGETPSIVNPSSRVLLRPIKEAGPSKDRESYRADGYIYGIGDGKIAGHRDMNINTYRCIDDMSQLISSVVRYRKNILKGEPNKTNI